MGLDQRPVKLRSKAGLCTKKNDTCDVSLITSHKYDLSCVNDGGKQCQITKNKVDIDCQCKVWVISFMRVDSNDWNHP